MIESTGRKTLVTIILPLLLLYISIQVLYFLFYSPPSYVQPLTWDKLGYYLYLPATFIYHDLHRLQFITGMLERYKLSSYFYQAHIGYSGGYVMSYTLGLALLEFPFFCIGHLMAHLLGYPADGFSMPYQFAITMGGTFYSMIGIWFLYHNLRYFFNQAITLITLLIIIFSTNYFYYSAFENGMTHPYLFTLYAAAIYYTIRWHEKPTALYAMLLGMAMGLAILMRPSEIIILVIPLLWTVCDKQTAVGKYRLLLKYWRHMLIICVVMLPLVVLQLAYWKYSSGHWLYNSYSETGQHFDFRHPQLIRGFLSIRKGWLLYTPVMALALLGLIVLLRKAKAVALSIVSFTLINIYIVFSWTMWYYGGSFSCRALVQSYAVLAIPMGFFMQYIASRHYLKIVTAVFVIAATILNLCQTMQYAKGMISTEGLSGYTYRLLFAKPSISIDDIARFEKLDVIKGTIVHRDTIRAINLMTPSDSSHTQAGSLILTKEEYILYNGKVDLSEGNYIRVSAHGRFDHIEYNYNKQAAMKLTFMNNESAVISEKYIRLEPLMYAAGRPLNVDYLGEPDTWANFNFAVKRPTGTGNIKLTVFNPGLNQMMIDKVTIENLFVR